MTIEIHPLTHLCLSTDVLRMLDDITKANGLSQSYTVSMLIKEEHTRLSQGYEIEESKENFTMVRLPEDLG